MRDFSLIIMNFQLEKVKDFFVNDIKKGYMTYNFSIKELDVKFLDVISFEEYLVKTKIEKDILLHSVYKVSNDILDLYCDSNSIKWKDGLEIVSSLPDDWKRKLSDMAIAQVKAGFVCLTIEERKIRVFEEPHEIGGFNKFYDFDYCVWTNTNNIIHDIVKIRDLVQLYYPYIKTEYLKKYHADFLREMKQKPFEYQFNHIFRDQGFKFFKYLFENFVVNGRGRNADISFFYRKLFDDGFIHAKPTPFMEWINQEFNLDIDKIKTFNEVKSVKRNSLYSTALESFKSKEQV